MESTDDVRQERLREKLHAMGSNLGGRSGEHLADDAATREAHAGEIEAAYADWWDLLVGGGVQQATRGTKGEDPRGRQREDLHVGASAQAGEARRRARRPRLTGQGFPLGHWHADR